MEHPIGVIGGMGPMASQLFYRLVTEHTAAQCDQDHVEMILISDTTMPDRTTAILSQMFETPRKQLLEDARMLERCGCVAIAITCNTAHFFADMIEKELSVPILHMIRETADSLARQHPGSLVGIMATDGTVRTGLYQRALEKRGLRPFLPSESIQREVMYQIYGRIKKGLPYDKESWTRIESAYRQAGCTAVLLACTELSVIKADEQMGSWFVDPMEVLARRVIEYSGRVYR